MKIALLLLAIVVLVSGCGNQIDAVADTSENLGLEAAYNGGCNSLIKEHNCELNDFQIEGWSPPERIDNRAMFFSEACIYSGYANPTDCARSCGCQL